MEASTRKNKVPPADGSTYEEYCRNLHALEQHLRRLKEMVSRYPIFLVVARRRYRFESPEEVDEFIALLRAEVERYASTRAAC